MDGVLSLPLSVRAGVDAGVPAKEDAAEAAPEGGCPEQEQRQEGARARKGKQPPAPRPTHFLAMQVSQHARVVGAIDTVHQVLVGHSPHLKKACVEAESAHLTLGVMALASEEDRRRASDTLAALAGPLADAALLAPVAVQVEGLSHFQNKVLYLDLRQDEGLDQLLRLAAAARSHFHRAGLLLEADRAFVPHITVAKTSKLQGWGGKGGRHGGRHGRGHWGKGGRHDWKAERRAERDAKQQRLEAEAGNVEALAAMDCEAGGSLEHGAAAAAVAAAGWDQELLEAAVAEIEAEVAAEEAAGGNGSGVAAEERVAASPQPPAAAAVEQLDGQQDAQEGTEGDPAVGAAALPQELPVEAEAQHHRHRDRHQQRQQRQQQQQQEREGGERRGPSWREIDAEAWAPHVAIEGGTAVLAEIQLCAMQGRRGGGYYPVLASLVLAPAAAAPAAEAEAEAGAKPGAAGAAQ